MLISVPSLILQETLVLGPMGITGYPLSVHRFFDDGIR